MDRTLSFFFLLWPAIVLAQSQLGTGALAGTVRDASGAAVPAAQITISQAETGLLRRVESNDSGQYFAPVLPAGVYKIRIIKAGFATLEEDNIVVNVGATSNVPSTLRIGDVAETMNVEATVAIDPAETDVSSLVDRSEISNLPINGRR